ncbi:ROK family protein [Macrococcoides canis]|uniref:ROK family protein n=1 Tax=Macrococcoides canis TaxID=1855823 RepID=UPI001060FEA0|nr:ROK family protein [Macrococcus canis]MEE1108154.1 ROK family protein [Macrococcus canis]TDM30118.1 ROK family protein [Macrococcus canis]TDM33347.1 ROK family protein [Macrococcus canis]
MKILGIDIGGTSIKADIYDENGKNLMQFSMHPTQIDKDKQTNKILEQVYELVESYMKNNIIDGIAISTAGVVNNNGEIVFAGSTIPGYSGIAIKESLEKRYNLPVSVQNDVNCAALAEMWLGNAKNTTSSFMITIGTGIGGALVIDNQLIQGYNFTAGEVGYIPIQGERWENKASASALIKAYEIRSGLKNQDGILFFEALEKGDALAQEVFNEFIDSLAEGLIIISYLFNPEVIIIGGGIMSRENVIIPALRNRISKKEYNQIFLPKKILSAKFGNEAGRLGATRYFLNYFGTVKN